MNCERTGRLIQLEYDGELDAAQSAELSSHLMRCPACREQRRQFEILRQALRTLAEEPMRPAAAPPPRVRSRVSARLVGAVAAGLVLAAAGLVAHLARRPPVENLQPPKPQIVAERIVQPPAPSSVARAHVEIAPHPDLIVRPIETSNPNVTIIWLYPTISTAQRPAEDSDSGASPAS